MTGRRRRACGSGSRVWLGFMRASAFAGGPRGCGNGAIVESLLAGELATAGRLAPEARHSSGLVEGAPSDGPAPAR